MRQIAVWLLLSLMILTGCTGGGGTKPPAQEPPTTAPKPSEPAPATPKHGIDRQQAEAMVSDYLQKLVRGELGEAQKLLVPAANAEVEIGPVKYTQFHLVGLTEVEEGWLVETRESLVEPTKPLSLVVTNFYLVVNEQGQAAIDWPDRRWSEAKAKPYRGSAAEAFPQGRALVLRQQTGESLIQPDLPNDFQPFGAGADIRFGVGRDGWGALALSPDLKQIAFVTQGTHPLLGLVDASGKVRGLDLWFEGGAGELAWSPDARFLAASNFSPRGVFVLQLWDLTANRPVPVTGLPDGKDISRLQWMGNTLHLRAGAERWMIDPATGRATQP